MSSSDERVAIVTGASTGIGRAIALELADDDTRVVVGDVREQPKTGSRYGPESERPTHREIEARGGTASFVRADVGTVGGCRTLIERAVDSDGRLDVLVNNAGIHVEGGLEELEPERWRRVIDVNLSGSFYCSKFAAPFLRERAGSIVNVASVHAIEGGAGPAYASSKAGLANLTRDLAAELGTDDVRVNAVCPGFVKTPRQDYLSDEDVERSREQTVLSRLGEPEDVAKAVSFLASADASWITGETLFVDGGWTAHRGV
ncbi:SDR family NAD(P)-dependent oxidoreductase [Natrarchaeobius oligotrophus]|uniref:SDR family oxidoreductase n=1 Tax=Natrarchaeobius chitinivorans TaxID=1679083 RepID=A0A3N6PQ93_NATCH|nr:SDR family NAD(P)-dependent oxidoreductase [Natrarchaeobius chitinivorans]RQH01426.1 SDR family oxidoreductase [Natrarchaeobius chitinivorans]